MRERVFADPHTYMSPFFTSAPVDSRKKVSKKSKNGLKTFLNNRFNLDVPGKQQQPQQL